MGGPAQGPWTRDKSVIITTTHAVKDFLPGTLLWVAFLGANKKGDEQ